jgi:two-component system, cell cycle sensor histidine kinase and response regulator CckA
LRLGQSEVCLADHCRGSGLGLELIARARSEGSRVPVILVGEVVEPEDDTKSIRAGAADFLASNGLQPWMLERAVRFALARGAAGAACRPLLPFAELDPNPVIELNDRAEPVRFNEAARRLLDSLGCESPAALLPEGTPAIVEKCLASGASQADLQVTIGAHTIEWSFFPILDRRLVHCHATDATQRLLVERQLRRTQTMEAVGQLSGGVAHDFNNLLTVIGGHAALLANGCPEDSPNLRPLREIRGAAERAGNLVRQLLMFSRKQVLRPTSIDLNAAIQSVLALLQGTLGEHVRVQVVAADTLPPIRADAGSLQQMLVALALNARDAMPQGGLILIATQVVTVTEEAARQNLEARPGQHVRLTVSDTGCGMSRKVLDHIFEPFFTTKGVGKGSGLGLASVYGMVKQHEGWIEVESEPGRGSAFHIHLPVRPDLKTAGRSTPGLTGRETPQGRETILVAEDEAALRELVGEILRWHGYKVFLAGCGAEALEIWRQHRDEIDLLLTDMVMPGMSGGELASHLRMEDPDLRVIYTSGYTPGMTGQDKPLLEGKYFLPKPYPPTRLAQLVRECLDTPVQQETAALRD